MGQKVDPFSFVRRPLARLSEFIFAGEALEWLGALPGFHALFFSEHVTFYVLMFFGCSLLFDLVELAIRPDVAISCKDDEPELPFGGEK